MKILCIGRNYVAHAKELNNQVPDEPVIFCKPDSSILKNKSAFFIPSFSQEVHHEIELVVKISRLGKKILPKFAHRYYEEIGLGIDFTARDLQSKLKSKGLPWTLAKGFDGSAPLGDFIGKDLLPSVDNINFRMEKNGAIVQQGNSGLMLFGIDELIAHLSTYFTLKTGDLIFTGTPAGVGPVVADDHLVGYIEDKEVLNIKVK